MVCSKLVAFRSGYLFNSEQRTGSRKCLALNTELISLNSTINKIHTGIALNRCYQKLPLQTQVFMIAHCYLGGQVESDPLPSYK